jgi:phosphoribosylformylglycinamidine synthase
VLRLKHPTTGVDTGRALAVTVDGNQRWCAVDAAQGTALTVAEGVLNLACVGARPVAVVDCLNLGNPEHPEVMHQLAGVVDGMAEACRALGVPVVGGNVSLYNESRGRDIDPTPVVGTLGVVDRLERRPPGVALADGDHLLLVGPRSSELGGSRWAASTLNDGRPLGPLPALDLKAHSAVAGVVRALVGDGMATGVHDVADGGLAVALGELVARSRVGLRLDGVDGPGELFSEAPSRVMVAAPAAVVADVERRCRDAGVAVADLGTAGGDRLVVDGLVDLAVADVVAAERDTLPAAMAP